MVQQQKEIARKEKILNMSRGRSKSRGGGRSLYSGESGSPDLRNKTTKSMRPGTGVPQSKFELGDSGYNKT